MGTIVTHIEAHGIESEEKKALKTNGSNKRDKKILRKRCMNRNDSVAELRTSQKEESGSSETNNEVPFQS